MKIKYFKPQDYLNNRYNKVIAMKGGTLMNNKITAFAIIAIVITMNLVSAQTNNGYGCFGWNMMGSYGAGYGFMWVFGWIFMLAILIALILLIVWLIKQLQTQSRRK